MGSEETFPAQACRQACHIVERKGICPSSEMKTINKHFSPMIEVYWSIFTSFWYLQAIQITPSFIHCSGKTVEKMKMIFYVKSLRCYRGLDGIVISPGCLRIRSESSFMNNVFKMYLQLVDYLINWDRAISLDSALNTVFKDLTITELEWAKQNEAAGGHGNKWLIKGIGDCRKRTSLPTANSWQLLRAARWQWLLLPRALKVSSVLSLVTQWP